MHPRDLRKAWPEATEKDFCSGCCLEGLDGKALLSRSLQQHLSYCRTAIRIRPFPTQHAAFTWLPASAPALNESQQARSRCTHHPSVPPVSPALLSFAEREDEREGDGAGDAQRDVPSRKDGLSDKEDRGQKDADDEILDYPLDMVPVHCSLLHEKRQLHACSCLHVHSVPTLPCSP